MPDCDSACKYYRFSHPSPPIHLRVRGTQPASLGAWKSKTNMADETTAELICPEVGLLTEIETNLPCSVNGCTKVLPNASSLRMHLIKTHNVISNANENEIFDKGSQYHNKNNARKKALYCCPVDGCVRGRNAGRPFSRLAHVKQVCLVKY